MRDTPLRRYQVRILLLLYRHLEAMRAHFVSMPTHEKAALYHSSSFCPRRPGLYTMTPRRQPLISKRSMSSSVDDTRRHYARSSMRMRSLLPPPLLSPRPLSTRRSFQTLTGRR